MWPHKRPEFFRPYLGDVGAVFALCTLALVGLVAIAALRVGGQFFTHTQLSKRVLFGGGIVVAAFALCAILADITLRFPRDINVPAPWSLLFYPAMAFVVEVAFHVLPLALVLGVLTAPGRALVMITIVVVAAIEPLFQVRGACAMDALTLFVLAQVFAFNLFELYVFRRFGFASMYAVRLVYYLCWHVLWGAARLWLLF